MRAEKATARCGSRSLTRLPPTFTAAAVANLLLLLPRPPLSLEEAVRRVAVAFSRLIIRLAPRLRVGRLCLCGAGGRDARHRLVPDDGRLRRRWRRSRRRGDRSLRDGGG